MRHLSVLNRHDVHYYSCYGKRTQRNHQIFSNWVNKLLVVTGEAILAAVIVTFAFKFFSEPGATTSDKLIYAQERVRTMNDEAACEQAPLKLNVLLRLVLFPEELLEQRFE